MLLIYPFCPQVFKWYACLLNRVVLSHDSMPPVVVVDNEFLIDMENEQTNHNRNMQEKRGYIDATQAQQFTMELWVPQLTKWEGYARLVIPYCSKGDHWNVFQVIPSEHRIVIYDSRRRGKSDAFILQRYKNVLDALQTMLHLVISMLFPQKKNTKSWDTSICHDVPKQANGYDCGVFSLLFMDLLCREQSVAVELSKQAPRNMRFLLASDILTDGRMIEES